MLQFTTVGGPNITPDLLLEGVSSIDSAAVPKRTSLLMIVIGLVGAVCLWRRTVVQAAAR